MIYAVVGEFLASFWDFMICKKMVRLSLLVKDDVF